ADVVVALDDGSTDDTGDILRAHPIVGRVLVNERREGYLGWHDGRNRNRLLAAAADVGAAWVISLDADERLDNDDAGALRGFVAEEALPSCAYGFELYRMVNELQFDPRCERVYRLFAFEPGQAFPNRRLDFVPIPTSIRRDRWVDTTLRIKHHGEPDAASRRARVAKFRAAGPAGIFSPSYANLQPLTAGP